MRKRHHNKSHLTIFYKTPTISINFLLLITLIFIQFHSCHPKGSGGGGKASGGAYRPMHGGGTASNSAMGPIIYGTLIATVTLIPIICFICIFANTRDIIRHTRSVKELAIAENIKLREGIVVNVPSISEDDERTMTTFAMCPPGMGRYSGVIGTERLVREAEFILEFELDERSGGYLISGTGVVGGKNGGAFRVREGFVNHITGRAYWVMIGGMMRMDCCLKPCIGGMVARYAPDLKDHERTNVLATAIGRFDWEGGTFCGTVLDSRGKKCDIEVEEQDVLTNEEGFVKEDNSLDMALESPKSVTER
mmetsp:Transcript_5783/g.7263  ORF Transcript_5783/g.7263 Transcript_5783/m.7263 type:complete len:308 (+) Transcript_5783:1-924(+)